MNRKDFLKGMGLAGLGLTLPVSKILADSSKTYNSASSCVLIPTETAGPFPLDLTANTTFFRQDITEGKAGTPLNVKLRIIGNANCEPMQNVRVNIWHCDKDGLYSGYDQQNNAGQAGQTYLRGYQMTDANGEVEFTTIFPGWYNGRICHIHFQVYVSSSYAAISQLTFDVATKNAIYAANTTDYTKGADPMSLASDNIFSDGYTYQIASLTANSSGGYDAELEVTVQGTGTANNNPTDTTGTTSIGHIEKENAKQFTLGQNHPNPHSGVTTIPFSLTKSSDVTIELWDLSGRKVASLPHNGLSSGDHQVTVDLNGLGLSSGNYVYQLEVRNTDGTFRDTKMMTAGK